MNSPATNYELILEGFGLDFALEVTTFFGGTVEGYRIPRDQGRIRGVSANYITIDELQDFIFQEVFP